jgi:hypothetical protein
VTWAAAPLGDDSGGLRHVGGVWVLTWPALDALGVDVAVTTRIGGVSTGPYESLNLGLHVDDDPDAVVENRRRAVAALGATLDDLVVAEQVHGARAAIVTARDRGRGARSVTDAIAGADALVTAGPGPVLAMLVADCVPVVLVDPTAGVLACVHAGWRGTAARVLDSALHAMGTLGSRPGQVTAAIGPAVSADRYQVGAEVAGALQASLGGATEGVLRADGTGRWLADLPEANRRILVEAGVPDHSIHRSAMPTGPRGPFFSDRASRPCGRFAALARFRP